jgi:hypothetical protein
MLFAPGGYAIRTGGGYSKYGNIKAFKHLSFNDVIISTFPKKLGEKILISMSLSIIYQVNLAETCMHAGNNISEYGNSRLSSRREWMLTDLSTDLLADFRADCSLPLAELIDRD